MRGILTYWEAKTPKERLTLLILGILCSLVLLWSLLISPVSQKIKNLSSEVEAKKSFLLSLDLASNSVPLASFNKSYSIGELESLMKSFEMNAQFQEEKAGEYALTFNALSFDKLVLFIEQCYVQYGLKLESLKIESLVQQGFVSGEARFN